MVSFTVRAAKVVDATVLSALIQRTIRMTNSYDYEPAFIESTCSNFTSAKVAQKFADQHVCAGVCDNVIVGTASFRRGKLLSLFVEPHFQHQGIGTQLVQHIERHAVSSGFSELWVSSSITARTFYAKFGYYLHKFEARKDGVTFLMSKSLVQ